MLGADVCVGVWDKGAFFYRYELLLKKVNKFELLTKVCIRVFIFATTLTTGITATFTGQPNFAAII